MGAVGWDRRLFDSLIPLPDGTSYNAHLVEGSQKTVLLETVDPTMTDILEEYSDLLERDDVDRVVELAQRNAENLYQALLQINGEEETGLSNRSGSWKRK